MLSKVQIFLLLLFLINEHLFAFNHSTMCMHQEQLRNTKSSAYDLELCNYRSQSIAERKQSAYAFLQVRIPELGNEYLEYNLETDKRKERALPVYIEFYDKILNPRKEDVANFQVSSKIKERIISENTEIARKTCIFMALGSEYLFPVPAKNGRLNVILYLDYIRDIASLNSSSLPNNDEVFFNRFARRSLREEVNFEPGKTYQLEIKKDPNFAIPVGSYSEARKSKFFEDKTVPGFIITFKELPANTKFAFNGKDDIGKTYEQVKKEFILYDYSDEKYQTAFPLSF